MRLPYLIISLLLISFTNCVLSSQSPMSKDATEKGWHFYDERFEEEPKKEKAKPKPVQPPQTEPVKQDEEVEINTQWLRDNLPKLLDKAMDNPTNENVANYYYAQRLAVDKATVFSEQSKEVMMFEPELSEETRRPTTQMAIQQHKFARNRSESKVLDKLFDRAGLWMFYRSDCGYCHKQFPVLEKMAKIVGADILAISIDGVLLDKQFPSITHVVDRTGEMARKFNVTITPTTLLVSKDAKVQQVIKYGLAPGEELVQRALYAAKRTNLITESDFNDTLEVKRVTVANEPIKIKESELEENPSALADIIRKRLKGTPLPNTTGAYQ